MALHVRARGLEKNYLTLAHHGADRAEVRLWVTRSLIKRGIWGAGQDTLLGNLRTVIRDEAGDSFPRERIEQRMAEIGKPLSFTDVDVDGLLDLTYGDKRTYAVLTTLFGSDTSTQLHVDHVPPITT